MTRTSLRPGPRVGLEIADARGWRIEATPGGGLRMADPTGPEQVLASPGDVARVVVLRDDQVPRSLAYHDGFDEVLVVLTDDSAVLVVPLHLLAHGMVTDAAELRTVSGADDFAQALGLALAPATDEDAALAAQSRTILAHGPVRQTLETAFWRHCGLLATALVGAVVSLVVDDQISATAAVVAAIAVLVLAVEQWRVRSTFLRLVTSRPPGADRTAVANRLDASWTNDVRTASLQIGATDIVHKFGATETWVAGPASGGVVACVVNEDVIRFVDRHDADLLVLGVLSWAPDGDSAALAGRCSAAGIELRHARGHGARTAEADLILTLSGSSPVYGYQMTQKALGDFVVGGPFGTTLIGLFVLLTQVSPLESITPLGGVAAAVAGIGAVITGAAQTRLWLWGRDQTRKGTS